MTDNEKKIIAAKRAYHKAWRAKNKDKIKQYNQRYWEKKILNANTSDN